MVKRTRRQQGVFVKLRSEIMAGSGYIISAQNGNIIVKYGPYISIHKKENRNLRKKVRT